MTILPSRLPSSIEASPSAISLNGRRRSMNGRNPLVRMNDNKSPSSARVPMVDPAIRSCFEATDRCSALVFPLAAPVKSEGLFASGVVVPRTPDRQIEVSTNDLRLAPPSGAIANPLRRKEIKN